MNSSNPGQSHLPVTHKPCERRQFVDGKTETFLGMSDGLYETKQYFSLNTLFVCFANKCARCASCALCLGFRVCMTEADALMLVSHKAPFTLLFVLLLYRWH